MPQTHDVIIIGGGIMGCSTALELARRGMDVLILEKDTIGKGPTGESSAIIRQHYSNALTARMALYSLRVFQNFEEQIGADCGFTETGFFGVAAEKDRAGLEANVALQQSVGIKTEIIDREAAIRIMPGIESGDLVAVAYEPEAGYADPYLTVNAYAEAAQRAGVTLRRNTPVTGVRFGSGKVSGVDTLAGSFDAPLVLNCTGAWAGPVAKMAGIAVPIDSCRVQVSFFRRPEGEVASHPIIIDFINAVYMRPETGNLTIVGLIDPSEADAIVNPDDYRRTVDDDFILETGEGMVARYPAMELSQPTGGYASLYAITPDWHPIVDEVPAGSGFYTCSGFSGHGFKLGPAVARMFADQVMGVSDPLFDPHLFRLARFAEDDPVKGQYEYSIAG